jgi:Sjoegren syndrome nuclear autoantigen 1
MEKYYPQVICDATLYYNCSNINISGIEDLCAKRDDLNKSILLEEEEKSKIQNDIRILTERLSKVNESLSKKLASRNEFDKTIAETEAAYMKVGVKGSGQTLTDFFRKFFFLGKCIFPPKMSDSKN